MLRILVELQRKAMDLFGNFLNFLRDIKWTGMVTKERGYPRNRFIG